MNPSYQQVPPQVVVAIDNVFEFLGWLYQMGFDTRARDYVSERIARLWLQDKRGPMRKLLLYIAELTQMVAKSPTHRQEGLRRSGTKIFGDIFRKGAVFGDAEIVDLLHRMIEHGRPGATGVSPTPFGSQAVPTLSTAPQQALGQPPILPIPPIPQLPPAVAASPGMTTAPISGAAGVHQPWMPSGAAGLATASSQLPSPDQSAYAFKQALNQRQLNFDMQLAWDQHVQQNTRKVFQ
jgi:hypothetical protein